MAVVPQETQLAFEYSVLEVVLMGRYPHLGAFEIEGPRDVAIARAALAATGTLELEARMFSTLSGGEKQRVIIAAALAQISAPTATRWTAGHPAARRADRRPGPEVSARDRRRSCARSTSHTPLSVVVSTHDLNFAAALCQTW